MKIKPRRYQEIEPTADELIPFRSAFIQEANNGIAKSVTIFGSIFPVYAQASHLPALNIDDEVLTVITEHGAFILARPLQANEAPCVNFQQQSTEKITLKFGTAAIHIGAQGEIILQTPETFITLSSKGEFSIAAKTIKQSAKNNITLKAAKYIKLNSAE